VGRRLGIHDGGVRQRLGGVDRGEHYERDELDLERRG
jgi:hypothetical protein